MNGCFSFQKTTTSPSQRSTKGSDFSEMYNPGVSVVNPQMTAVITSASKAEVYFRIKTRELKNVMANPEEEEIGIYVKYFLRNSSDFQLVDTCSFRFNFNIATGEYVYGHFNVKLNSCVRYKLVVDFANSRYDIHKRLLQDIKNEPGFNDCKFLLKTLDGGVIFSNVVVAGQSVQMFASSEMLGPIDVEYYTTKKFVPVPPYLNVQGRMRNDYVAGAVAPDSVFKYNIGDTLVLSRSGFYALGATSKNEKFGIVVSDNKTFPMVTTLSAMKEPISLLATERECAIIDSAQNLKKGIDAFWLRLSKDEKAAKEQVRVFYNRVALANTFFTNTMEGWKTDRGMIFIMLGPPTIVNITPTSEEWTYGSEQSGTVFTFDNFSGLRNDFWLLRSNTYTSIWQQVITTWRSGKIFTVTKLNNE